MLLARRLAALLLALGTTGSARAAEPEGHEERLEPGGVVVAAYNHDLGVGGGFVLNLARVDPDRVPYRWRLRAVLLAFSSLEDTGWQGTLQNAALVADLPAQGRGPRVTLHGFARRQANAGWYGLGNASAHLRPWESLDPEQEPRAWAEARRANHYGHSQASLLATARLPLTGEWQAFAAGALTTNRFDVYAGSQLEADLAGASGADAAARVAWAVPHSTLEATAGAAWDLRDHETSPRLGGTAEASVRAGVGVRRSGAWWGGNLTARAYLPVTTSTVAAARLVLDTLGGDVPFYALARYGGLEPGHGPGGGRSLRGLNLMRLHGRHKILLNAELRPTLWAGPLGPQPGQLGLTAFVDTGRVWASLPADPALDGEAGFHTGAGGGVWFRWGESFLLRCEVGVSAEGVAGYVDVDHVF